MCFIRSVVFNKLQQMMAYISAVCFVCAVVTRSTKALTHLLFYQYAIACLLQQRDFYKKEEGFLMFLGKLSLKSVNICKSYSVFNTTCKFFTLPPWGRSTEVLEGALFPSRLRLLKVLFCGWFVHRHFYNVAEILGDKPLCRIWDRSESFVCKPSPLTQRLELWLPNAVV